MKKDKTRQIDTGDNPGNTLFDNQLLNYSKAAMYLAVSPVYLRELKAARKIKAVEIGPRCVRFRVASLNEFIREREVS